MNCDCCFHDYIVGDPAMVHVNVVLQPNSEYTWELRDQHGNIYFQEFTTNSNGAGDVDMSMLPAGFANPGMGPLILRVMSGAGSTCGFIPMPVVVPFDCVQIDFKGGTTVKDSVGCELDLAENLPVLPTPENFAGTIADGHSLLSWLASPGATGYIVEQNDVVIHAGPELMWDALGLVNGQTYQFTVVATADGFTNSPAAIIHVTPGLNVMVFVLYRDTNTPPTEAEILAADSQPITNGANYSVQFTNPVIDPKYLMVFEPLTQPIKTAINYGIGDDPIGPGGVFAIGPAVTIFRGYYSNYKTAIPNDPTTFKI